MSRTPLLPRRRRHSRRPHRSTSRRIPPRHPSVPPRHSWHRRHRRLTALAIVVLGGTAWAWLARDRSPVGHWRSEAGRQAYLTSYTRAMTLLPAPSRTLDVLTDYGTVRVYEFRPAEPSPDDVPVLLMPGRTSGVPMWSANLPDLAARRTVYALDALGDAGLSTQTRRLEDGDDQAAWVHQVLRRLDLPKVHLVGHSFGGALATGYALRHPDRVASLTLLEPVLVFASLRWQVYVRATIASLPFLPQSWRSSALAGIGGAEEVDLDDPLARMISDASANYAAALPVPRRPSDAQLRSLAMPVHVALAGNSPLHDARAAADVARATLPDARVVLWPDTTHSLPMEVPDRLDAEMLTFMATHEPPPTDGATDPTS